MKAFLFIIISVIAKHAMALDPACYAGPDFPLCSDASCGGTCDWANGCNCADGFTECVPTSCVMGTNQCCSMLSGWYYDTTKSCCTQQIQCNPACGPDEDCELINGNAECICNLTYYAGKVPQDLQPTVNCSGGTMTTSFSSCMLEALGYDINTTYLIDPSNLCLYNYEDMKNNIRMENIQVRATIGWCGNIATNDSTTINFTNTIHIDPYSGPIIYKNPIIYNFTCQYNLTMQTSLGFTLHPVQSTITIPTASGVGAYTVTMAAYTNAECTIPLQQDQTLYVGSNLYLGLMCSYLDVNTFVLRVESCYATPVNNSASTTQVTLVQGGCAVQGGNVPTTVLQNGDAAEARIMFTTFQFQGYSDVYIFCSVKICNKSQDCSKCGSSRANTVYTGLGIPLKIQNLNSISYSSSGHVTGVSWALLASTLLAYFYMKSF